MTHIRLDISEVWLENKWWYADDISEAIKNEGYYIRVNTSNELRAGIDFDWSIGISFSENNMRTCGNRCLIGDYEELPPDTIKYKVISGRSKKSEVIDPSRILGELVLVAK